MSAFPHEVKARDEFLPIGSKLKQSVKKANLKVAKIYATLTKG